GKEGNELEAHRAGVISAAERQLEYHNSEFEDLVAKLQQIPTKVIADTTGYNPRTVRRLKQGEFRPSANRLSQILTLASRHGIIPRYDGIQSVSGN
ncbi:MAG TPA: hypothetical protein VGR29_08835, partial [Thermomicrobiales bacterium]|nr:hypothetical protein [Thermomicrobiales bacterium]